MSKEFYTYIYFIDGIPEYVGKGKGERHLSHFTRRSKSYWSNHLKSSVKNERTIEIAKSELMLEDEAFAQECHLISLYGRKDLKTGTLWNLTKGGEGMSGRVVSLEERTKKSIANKKRLEDPEIYAKSCMAMKTMWQKPGEREKRSASQKIAQSQEGVQERKSKALKISAQNPEVAAKRSASLKVAQNLQETKDKKSASLKIAHGTPEMRAAKSAAKKKYWDNWRAARQTKETT